MALVFLSFLISIWSIFTFKQLTKMCSFFSLDFSCKRPNSTAAASAI